MVHLKSFNHIHDLITPQQSWVEKIRGGLASPFASTPSGIAYRNQRLYICDTAQSCVHIWNLATGYASKIGDSGNVTLEIPVDVAVDDNNNVYIADSGRGEVIIFNLSKNKVSHRLRPNNNEPMKPVALAVRAGKVYVADIATHRILVYNTTSGNLETSFGRPGRDPGQFYFPMGIEATNNGQLLVSDSMNGQVQRFNKEFLPLTAIGGLGNRYGDMGRPRHLAIGPDGIIFVADTEFARVHMFNNKGQLLMLLGGPDNKLGNTPMPTGLAIAPDLPPSLLALIPPTFDAKYYLFVSNTLGSHRLSLYAMGNLR
ncbi:hypothetical protein JYU10_00580 [bacterium AH-315-J04]|nr:hypothetical protein [bacterium AH-315-J04]